MVDLKTYTPKELRELARGRLGLIVGPAATRTESDWSTAVRNELQKAYAAADGEVLNDVIEALVRRGEDSEPIRQMLITAARKATPAPTLRILAKIRWSAILSLTTDRLLEDALVARASAQPGCPDATIIVDLSDVPPEHTLHVYKLVGQWDRGQVVVTHSDLLRRVPLWPRAVEAFLERVKGSPILCLGMEDSEVLLEHVVGHLGAVPARRPARLLFLANDPVVANSRVRQIVPESMIALAEGGLREVCDAVEPKARNLQLSLSYDGTPERTRNVDVSESAALVDFVPSVTPPDIGEKARLLDLLFMPDFSNWEPYAGELDFRRPITDAVTKSVVEAASEADDNVMVVLQGRAGSGKTVVLRRVAFDLAQQGYVVAWLKRYWHSDGDYLLDGLFAKLHEGLGDQPVILAADDPSRLGSLTLSDVVATAERHNVRLVLLVGVRTSDHQQRDLAQYYEVTVEHELPDEFDEQELGRFREYVVALGMVGTTEEASAVLAGASGSTRDTLSVLYYLLPSTRQALSLSVQDEYLRLGEPARLEKLVTGAVESSSKRFQSAYAMVAVSFRYGAPLPIEVLISALGVSYGEWFEDVAKPGPAGGILYPDEADDLEGTCYRPRNELVAQFILKLINGGTFARDGEVEVLKRLLGSCRGSGSVYREYCKAILAPADRLEGLTPAQGLALYDAALTALPQPNGSLLHHKGVWLRKRCADLDGAIAVCEQALKVGSDSAEAEPPQLIHTSIAAALFQKIENGSLPLDEGKMRVLRELEQSKDVQFVNAHSIHVYARLLAQLASRHSVEAEGDRAYLLNSAIGEIDRTVLLLRHSRLRAEHRAKDLHILETEKDRILLEAGTQDELDARAQRLWDEHRNQSGFALAIRKRTAELFGAANTGAKYNVAYQKWESHVSAVGGLASLSSPLAEVGLTLYYDWQVRPRSVGQKDSRASGLRWEMMEECSGVVLTSERYRDDALYLYMRGLALAHLDKWSEADLVFERIRRLRLAHPVLHLPRDYLLGAYGAPRKIQGRIKPAATEVYFVSDELARSWRADRDSRWRSGEIQHAYLCFSFAGPRATLDEHRVPGG